MNASRRRPHGQRLVHDRDGADAPDGLVDARLRSADCSRRACNRNSDEMVCRLFLTRWWTSRMVASCREQQLVALAHLGDVAHQQQPAGHLAAGHDRHAAAEQGDLARLVNSSMTGDAVSRARRAELSLKPISVNRMPSALRCADAVEHAHRVR